MLRGASGSALGAYIREIESVRRSRIHKNWPNILSTTSIHQLHQFLAPDISIRLRRVEAAFCAAEGYEFDGGLQHPSAADEDAVGGGCALEVVEEGCFFYAGLSLPFLA